MAATVTRDFEAWLSEAVESPPCGPNLEHDLSFFELEAAARGKPEQRIGDAVKPAEDPKWSKVVELAQGLLLRTKDLRIAIHLTRALTRTDGLPGRAVGISFLFLRRAVPRPLRFRRPLRHQPSRATLVRARCGFDASFLGRAKGALRAQST